MSSPKEGPGPASITSTSASIWLPAAMGPEPPGDESVAWPTALLSSCLAGLLLVNTLRNSPQDHRLATMGWIPCLNPQEKTYAREGLLASRAREIEAASGSPGA